MQVVTQPVDIALPTNLTTKILLRKLIAFGKRSAAVQLEVPDTRVAVSAL